MLLRRFWPDSALAIVCLAALIFACFIAVPALPANPDIDATWRIAGSASLALLVIVYVTTYVRRRTFLVEPPLVAVLLVVARIQPPGSGGRHRAVDGRPDAAVDAQHVRSRGRAPGSGHRGHVGQYRHITGRAGSLMARGEALHTCSFTHTSRRRAQDRDGPLQAFELSGRV
jgi:hypothetical protein